MKYTDIKTFEDACKVEDLNPNTVLPDVKGFPIQDRDALLAHAMLIIIVRAANRLSNKGKEWKPDWNNWDEYKYYAWFEMGSSGFRFGDFDLWDAHSSVGSRLCFKESEVCEYIGKQFEGLYKSYFTL